MFTYVLIFALVMLAISAFVKKILIYIALIPAWYGVIILSSRYEDSAYIQATAGVVIIYAIVQMVRVRKGNLA